MSIYCMYTKADSCVDRSMQKATEILLYGQCMVTPICCFSKMAQVRNTDDKLSCVQT